MAAQFHRSGTRGARWILSAPLLVFLLLVVAYAAFSGIETSFQDRTLLNPEPSFTGFANYATVLNDSTFWSSLGFTVFYTVAVTVVELLLGFGLALLFDRGFPGKRWLLSVIIIPIMVAPSLMGIMFRLILNDNIGTIPAVFKAIGSDISLFSGSNVIPLVVALDLVQWTPFTFLLLYSALQSVPQELYEAASIDRAGYWRVVKSIIVPLIVPTLVITGFLRAIDAFRTFDTIYILTGGGPGTKTTTLSIYIYKVLSGGNFGVASAAAVIVALITLPLVPLVVGRITRGALANL
ncbi:MAG: sugar ABC transporter permease [Microbacteriaceae bacterium]|nr:sugar ABC transporter permease [Microbacteriaceae bacterium]